MNESVLASVLLRAGAPQARDVHLAVDVLPEGGDPWPIVLSFFAIRTRSGFLADACAGFADAVNEPHLRTAADDEPVSCYAELVRA